MVSPEVERGSDKYKINSRKLRQAATYHVTSDVTLLPHKEKKNINVTLYYAKRHDRCDTNSQSVPT
jgi:hypothetical protein